MGRKTIRLNRFIAQAGVCSRRKAETLILQGKIKVNGAVVRDLAYQVTPDKDQVYYGGSKLVVQPKHYLMLHKPLNMLTSLHDPEQRRTLQGVVKKWGMGRLYPIGRLDRNSTGLLLLTNDGLLARHLAHPSSEVPKQYKLELDRALTLEDQRKLREGIKLADGWIKVDELRLDSAPSHVEVTLHSGRNRILRRLFQALGYHVCSLCRTKYGPLHLGNLAYGASRQLTAQEIGQLQDILQQRGRTKVR